MSEARKLADRVARAKRVGARVPVKLLSIAGTVLDSVAAPITGAAITATLNGVTLATTTSAAGAYSFPAGFEASTTYTITCVLAGYTVSPDPLPQVVAAANITNGNFVLTAV